MKQKRQRRDGAGWLDLLLDGVRFWRGRRKKRGMAGDGTEAGGTEHDRTGWDRTGSAQWSWWWMGWWAARTAAFCWSGPASAPQRRGPAPQPANGSPRPPGPPPSPPRADWPRVSPLFRDGSRGCSGVGAKVVILGRGRHARQCAQQCGLPRSRAGRAPAAASWAPTEMMPSGAAAQGPSRPRQPGPARAALDSHQRLAVQAAPGAGLALKRCAQPVSGTCLRGG